MGLLQKLKSALGLNGSGSPGAGRAAPQDVDVTVEREPSSDTEDAVKGTDTASTGTEPSEPPEPETTGVDVPDAETDDTADDDEDSTAETATDEDDVEAAEIDDGASDDAADDTGAAEAGGVGVDVTEINGVGPAYGQRLNDAGVEDVAELAEADAEELGEATGLSPNRISGWIEQAEEY